MNTRFLRVLAITLLLVACGRETKPPVPETVYVTVTKFKKLPQWAVAPIDVDKPTRNGDTVRAHLTNEDALDAAFDRLTGEINCRLRLLAKLDKGEAVSPQECSR